MSKSVATIVVLSVFILFPFYFGLWKELTQVLAIASAITWLFRNISKRKHLVSHNTAVLVTGASQGIGRAVTLDLASKGFYVFAGVRNESKGESLQHSSVHGHRIVPLILDITKKDHCDSAKIVVQNFLKKKELQLIAIINNAGYDEQSPLELISKEKLTKQFDGETSMISTDLSVNVLSQVSVTQTFLPFLRAAAKSSRTSRIVFISGFGRLTIPFRGPFCASKIALESIADAFRVELKKWNIDVAIVQPSPTQTLFEETTKKTRKENIESAKSRKEVAEGVLASYQKSMENSEETKQKITTALVSSKVMEALLDTNPSRRYQAGLLTSFYVPLLDLLPEPAYDWLYKV